MGAPLGEWEGGGWGPGSCGQGGRAAVLPGLHSLGHHQSTLSVKSLTTPNMVFSVTWHFGVTVVTFRMTLLMNDAPFHQTLPNN